jgi:hypothetical protein
VCLTMEGTPRSVPRPSFGAIHATPASPMSVGRMRPSRPSAPLCEFSPTQITEMDARMGHQDCAPHNLAWVCMTLRLGA